MDSQVHRVLLDHKASRETEVNRDPQAKQVSLETKVYQVQ